MPVLSNARHEAFAQALAKGETADAAYVTAGYKPNRGNAIRLKANERISARVDEIVNGGARRAEVSVARVLQELARIGTSDVRRLFDENGSLRPIQDLDDDTAAAISSVEVVTKRLPTPDGEPPEVEYVHKFRMWDKNSALDKIAKHIGMFVERHEHTSPDGSMTPKGLDVSGLSTEALAEIMRAADAAKPG